MVATLILDLLPKFSERLMKRLQPDKSGRKKIGKDRNVKQQGARDAEEEEQTAQDVVQ